MRFIALLGLGVFAVAVSYLSQGQSRGQAPAPVAAQAVPKPPGPDTLANISACLLCHSVEDAVKNKGAKLFVQVGSTKFVRLDENITWSSNDLHSRAYQNLTGKLGQKMERLLKAAKPNPDAYQVTTDTACLACHATEKVPHEQWANGKKNFDEAFDVSQGVTCEMCHGYASNWSGMHAKIENVAGKPTIGWREWSPADKRSWGLVNLRDPAVRAEKCASCHIGNEKEGKFVTHEMYAAGHPPLPPLDAIAYMRDQPRHWGLPRELSFLTDLAKADPDKAWKLYHYRSEDEKGEVYAARQLASATLATFLASMKLLDQQAASEKGLDFASFDCYACHHDLKYPSPRQDKGYAGIPGRPTFRPGTQTMVKLLAAHAGDMKDGGAVKAGLQKFDEAYRELALAFGAKTFGDAEKIHAAVAKLETWCKSTAAEVAKVRYSREESLRLLRGLVAAGKDDARQIADAETAALLAWAFLTLSDELKPAKADLTELKKLETEMESLVVTRLRKDPTATKAAKTPDPLNAGAMIDAMPIPVEDRLTERMIVFNQFDAPKLRALYARIEPLVAGWK